jgi:hypothetical protein
VATDTKCTLTERLFRVWLGATMSFRPFSLDVSRGGLALFVFLACVGVSRAEDAAKRSIEIVPLRGTKVNTNANQFQPPDTQNLTPLFPGVPHSFEQPAATVELPPPPRQQTATPSLREREMLDRRKNWVFMTPEDFSGESKDTSITGDDKDANGTRPTSAMERYYQHLYDSERAAATNQFNKLDKDRWNAGTNSAGLGLQNGSGAGFVTSPFNTVPDPEVFRSARPNVFSDIFGSDADTGTPSPESVRLKAEQKAHMDDFKELWNIGQPPAAPVSASAPSSSSSSPVFGLPQGAQPAFSAVGLPQSVSSQGQAAPLHPAATSGRIASPPRADFAPPQRPF